MLVAPAFAASPGTAQPGHMTTVVKADVRSGRLVRAVVRDARVKPAAAPAEPGPASPADLENLIDRIAGEQGVESPLVHSVIRAESNYNANALSSKGAQGIMQLIPATARRFGVADTFNPKENIEGGVRYLRFLLDYYQGDYPKAIAAYNAGEAAVDKYHGIPPYAETQNYVFQVARNLKTARQKKARAAVNVAVSTRGDGAGETSRPIQTSVGSDGLVYYRTP
jgi:soluble lytic murein transglycosylase-like protein